jgi:16S rRNA processing protein RimM
LRPRVRACNRLPAGKPRRPDAPGVSPPVAQRVAGAVDAEAAGREPPADLVELGCLRGAYGLRGWSHVQSYSEDAQALRGARRWWLVAPKADDLARGASGPVRVTGLRQQGGGLIAKWQGCDDPEAAQALKGWRVAVSRADFPELPAGEFYWVDLIGALVVNRAGVALGTVSGLRSNGVHDLLEVARPVTAGADPGRPAAALLIPMVDAYLDSIDPVGRRIQVDWDPGW